MSPLDPDEQRARLAEAFRWTGPPHAQIVAGVGTDDCAVLRLGPSILVVTSDYINSNPISVQLGLATYSDLGSYLVGVNVADLCGSGAAPIGIMINIVWPRDADESDFLSLVAGIQSACVDYGIGVLGGDTKLGKDLVLNATAIGSVATESQLNLQTAAKVGDTIWASGPMGSCAAATLGLTKYDLGAEWRQWASDRILRPRAPVELVALTTAHMLSGGGADISDGLGADLLTICQGSNVGAEIDLELIPYEAGVEDVARLAAVHPGYFALTVGGDLQFLLTARPAVDAILQRLGYLRIGKITDESMTLVTGSAHSSAFPIDGHRDGRGLSFPDEIAYLLQRVANE